MHINLKEAVREGLTLNSLEKITQRMNEILDSGAEECCLTIRESQRKNFYAAYRACPKFTKFFFTGIYDLGICRRLWLNDVFKRLNINKWYVERCNLYTYSVHRSKKIKIFNSRDLKTGYTELYYPGVTPDSDKFTELYNQLELWVNESKKGTQIKDNINEIHFKDLHVAHLEPIYYDRHLVSKRKSFKKQKIVRLKDLVDFIIGKPNCKSALNPGSTINIAHVANCRGDFDVFSSHPFTYYAPEMVEAKEGDIIMNVFLAHTDASSGEFLYVIDAPLKEKLYLGEHIWALRLKSNKVTKEYLYLYLKSDLIRDLFVPSRSVPNRKEYLYKDFMNLPVTLPKTAVPMADDPIAVETYKALYTSFYGKKKDGEIVDRYALAHGAVSRTDYEDTLRDEYRKKIARKQDEDVAYYIQENKREMEITAKNRAYKATVVLAGSILEAFLIDWASATDGKDYFSKPFNNRGEEMRLNEAISYLSKRIQEETRRPWKQQVLANKIMELRNRIHPSVFLRDKTNVTKEDCDNVCRWLDEIMESREMQE